MDPYDERYDPEEQPNVGIELAGLSYQAGYGKALMDIEAHNSSDAAGDRIVEASRRLSGSGMWGDPFASTEPEYFE